MEKLLIDFLRSQMSLDEEEFLEIAKKLPVGHFKKGTILIHQGDIPSKCWFVLKGCVRQFAVDEDGKETTSEFYTEHDVVNIFNSHEADKSAKFSLVCLEDSVLIIGDLSSEEAMYEEHSILAKVSMNIMSQEMGKLKDAFADFVSAQPELRFKQLVEKRPDLLKRVPQHQLASYLGITPESLSRIKKRVKHRD